MIGDTYWATGIEVRHLPATDLQPARWSASADFYDDGFTNDDLGTGAISTQGKFGTRYLVREPGGDGADLATLTAVIDVVRTDADKLGVVFRQHLGKELPELYIDQNNIHDYPPLIHMLLTEQAERLGWTYWVGRRYVFSPEQIAAVKALPDERFAAMGPETLSKLFWWHIAECRECNHDNPCPCEWAEPQDATTHSCNCSKGWGGKIRALAREKGAKL